MSRLILLFLLIAAVVAVVSLVVSAWNRPAGRTAAAPPPTRSNPLQKAAFPLLMVVMLGVGSGLMGAG